MDSNNKAHHLQLQDPEGDQMTFGKERNGEPEQLLSITATTANTSGGNLELLGSSQARLQQMSITRYNPPPFNS